MYDCVLAHECTSVHVYVCVWGSWWLLVLSEVLSLYVRPWPVLVRIIGSYLYIDRLVQGAHLFLQNFPKHPLSKSNPTLYASGSLSI